MALTGSADGEPLAPPASLVPAVSAMGDELAALTSALGEAVELDATALLGERAAIAGLTRRGRCSCGGGTRLVRTLDGWLAIALPRPEDLELVPAWLGGTEVAAIVGGRRTRPLVEAAIELGLAVAAVGERDAADGPPLRVDTCPRDRTPRPLGELLVVDLSSLWAGPLAGHLLALAGARVVKVESKRRPDGARRGPEAFYDLLHAGQDSVALDLRDDGEVRVLRRLVAAADVVIEASRPRALEQLGVDAAATVAGGAIWLSITGHGRDGPAGARVAFGDDAAVAGGLVAGPVDAPVFCADAVADPLTGLLGAVAVLDHVRRGQSALIDVSMAGVAAWCAHAPPDVGRWDGPVAPPRARRPAGAAAALGADTEAVLAALGLR